MFSRSSFGILSADMISFKFPRGIASGLSMYLSIVTLEPIVVCALSASFDLILLRTIYLEISDSKIRPLFV